MKKEKEKNVNLIPLLEGSVIEATVSDGGHSLLLILRLNNLVLQFVYWLHTRFYQILIHLSSCLSGRAYLSRNVSCELYLARVSGLSILEGVICS